MINYKRVKIKSMHRNKSHNAYEGGIELKYVKYKLISSENKGK